MRKVRTETVSGIGLRDALRATGLGEDRYAQEFGGFLERLSDKKEEASSGKLWLDAMKEWARHLGTPVELREQVCNDEDGGPVVELVHHVARPGRERKGDSQSRQIGFLFSKEGE